MINHQNKTIWVVNVPVATVWTTPDSPRPIDEEGITVASSMTKWLEKLDDDLKRALCEDNLVQSQLLYGEKVLVEDCKEGWANIIIPTQPSKKDDRGYPGFVPERQLKEISDSDWQSTEVAVVQKKQTLLLDGNKQPSLELSYLTALPVLYEEERFVNVRTPGGRGYVAREDVTVYPSQKAIPKGNGADLLKTGESFIDLPYFWGGMSAYGYDCSGFAYNMHKAHGYEIPRDASDQAMAGEDIPLEEIQPGDLLFFAYEEGKGRVHHVGFYYGDGKLLHSPNVGKSIEIIDLTGTNYEKELCRARRYWQKTEAPS